MLAALRQANAETSADKAVELLNRGVAPQSVWDALFAGANELLMRAPGMNVPSENLPSVTTSAGSRKSSPSTTRRRWTRRSSS